MKRKNKSILTRREFMAGATASAFAFTYVPKYVLGQNGQPSANNKLNIAAIGSGGRGAGDIGGCESENIVALCDVDNHRSANKFSEHPKAHKYKDFREMLEKEEKNIDAVIVATPDHTHAVAAMMAMKMGKHVYCEKPLTHSIYEARMMTEAARKYKVATQMGNQGHSDEGVRLICEWIWAGAIGDVTEVHSWTNRPVWPQGIDRPKEKQPVPPHIAWDLWLGPAAERPFHSCYAPFNWRGWWDFGTGALGDMACHILDPVFWSLKLYEVYPTSVEACKVGGNKETYPHGSIVHFDFPARKGMPPVKAHWYDGGLYAPRPEELEPSRRWPHDSSGTLFVGTKGKLICGCYAGSPRIIPETKMRDFLKTEPEKTIPRSIGHHKEWIEACKGGKPAGSNFDYAGPLTEMVLIGNLAIASGKKVEWNGKEMKVTNDIPEAQAMVNPPYRQGWSM